MICITREEIREYLNAVYDLERLVTRISYRTANPRDLIAFKTSLGMIPACQTAAFSGKKRRTERN